MSLLRRVLLHEGFREKPYLDTVGVSTFGHGLTFITKEESEHIVDQRLKDISLSLIHSNPWLTGYSTEIMGVLIEMGFQLGIGGLSKFKNMWAALEAQNYATAADEMLDSKWAEQTPARAKELADIVRGST